MNKGFFAFMGTVFKLMMLNILFIAMCVPIVTIGASCVAMSHATLQMNYNRGRSPWREYWDSFRQNFKQATVLWLPAAFILAISTYDAIVSFHAGGIHAGLRYLFLFVIILVVSYLSYVFPLLSWFENTSRQTARNAVLMALRHFPWTLVILLIEFFPLVMYSFGQPETAANVILIMFIVGFACQSYACSWFFVNKIFPYYVPDDDGERE